MDTQLAQIVEAAMTRFKDRGGLGRFLIADKGESFLHVKVWNTFTTPSPSLYGGPRTLIIDLKDGSVVQQ